VFASGTSRARVTVDGKFFRAGTRKFHPKGVAYGPFAPNGAGECLAGPEQTRWDFALIRELGANLLRVYTVPPAWFLDLAQEHDLRLLVDVPWNKQARVLDAPAARNAVRETVRHAARACARHPAVFAISVVNELPPDVVRWSGAAAVEAFLDELAAEVKAVVPECLCTFGNYPTTEFLRPRGMDFACFNVYLHDRRVLRNYLARLQTLADTRPLVLGEFGMDAMREGEARQAALVAGTIETAFRAGLAGVVAYSFTDEWYKDGRHVENWRFGLTDQERKPRPAFAAAQRAFQAAPYFPPPVRPAVSVVVAGYNSARTLGPCLDSLSRLNYPDYEVILVDDGSTDDTAAVAGAFPAVRYIRHERNLGLSVARNTGIAAARGEVVAFTDADCRADEDWLHYTVGELLDSGAAGVGGHNLLPPDDSWVAAAVMVSPGGPAHVLLTDRVAEHIPGCNMVFWKRALEEVGGFDPQFRKAGDDVDICWRLQQQDCHLGFSHAGFVWHARRSTIRAYLQQQQGYGEAEALLARKHPEYFNPLGGSLWQGRIYAPASGPLLTRRPMIYHGRFGGAPFQSLYEGPPAFALMAVTTLEYHALVTLPLLALGVVFAWLLPLGIASALLSLGVCAAAAWQADLPRRRHFWSRPLVGLLHALQPVVRGWARYRGRLFLPLTPLAAHENLDSLSRQQSRLAPREVVCPDRAGRGRVSFLAATLDRLGTEGWQHRVDTGWGGFDLEVYGSRWSKLQLTTVAEHTPERGAQVCCRLRTRWTLPARLAFSLLAGVSVLTTAAWVERSPLAWLLLLAAPALAVVFQRDQQNLRRVFAVFLEQVAAAWDAQDQPTAAPKDSAATHPLGKAPGPAGS
jgi:GT2 family glycosyltransferase